MLVQRIALLAVLGSFVFAAGAQAWAPTVTSEARLAAFLPIARAAWPDSPCAGRETVRLHATIAADDYSSYGYGEYKPVAHALPEQCAVEITDIAYQGDASQWCSMLVHEFGHLAGLGHNDDPTSIMFNGALVSWPRCVTASNPPSPMAAARYYLGQYFPIGGGGWRMSCTPPLGRHPRCRASTARGRVKRFVVRVDRVTRTVVSVEPR